MPPKSGNGKRNKFISDKSCRKGISLVSDTTLSSYLKEISSYQPLSRENEEKLGRKIHEGDQKALNELVTHNLKYVVTVANKYRGCGIPLCDLINEGNIGLIQSANKIDPDRKVKFITYGVWWIRQSIMHAIANNSGTVRLPIKQAGILSKIEKKFREMAQTNSKEPSPQELANELGIRVAELESIMRVYRTHLSLNTPIKDQIEASYLDFLVGKEAISAEASLIKKDLASEVLILLKELSERESLILRLRFGFDGPPFTLEEIGKLTNLSRERVRQIEKRAKEKLRVKAKSKLLEEYLT